MESLYSFSQANMWEAALILMRVSAFIVTWPVFGTSSIPHHIKVLVMLGLTGLLLGRFVHTDIPPEGYSVMEGAVLVLREICVGVFIGFLGRTFLFVLTGMAHLISVSMGLSSGQVFNPGSDSQISPLEHFQVALGTLIFLALNGHFYLIKTLVESFQWFPLSNLTFPELTTQKIAYYIQSLTLAGVQLSAPVVVAILFANLAMAVVGRAVPQINVLVTSLPVNILIGFALLLICLPMMFAQMPDLLNETIGGIFLFMRKGYG